MKTPSKSEQLEKNRTVLFQIGLLCALTLVFCAFQYKTTTSINDVFNNHPTNEWVIEDIPNTFTKPVDMPLPKLVSTELEIVDNNTEVNTETNFQSELGEIKELVFVEVTEYIEERKEELEVVLIAEKMAEFPGGTKEMYRFIGEHISYPQIAIKTGIQGTVYVSFIVEPDGSLSHLHVVRSIGGGCDEEAMRIIKIMPKWEPAQQGTKNVRLKLTLPITFKIVN